MCDHESEYNLVSQLEDENVTSGAMQVVLNTLSRSSSCLYTYNFIYLFLAVLGLPCCPGLPFAVVHGPLITGASRVLEHGLLGTRASVVEAPSPRAEAQ